MESDKIKQRMGRTQKSLDYNLEATNKISAIRKNAMKGAMPDEEQIKWMVRELVGALSFQSEVMIGWIQGDVVMLDRNQKSQSEPQSNTEMEVPLLGDIAEEAAKLDDEEEIPQKDNQVVEGADKIKAILSGKKGENGDSNISH